MVGTKVACGISDRLRHACTVDIFENAISWYVCKEQATSSSMLKISASNKCKCAWEDIFAVAYKRYQHTSCQNCKFTLATSQLFGYAH